MTYLLDVSALIALLWRTHVHHQRVRQWQGQQDLAVCPLTELGFLRISTQASFGLEVVDARKVLRDWKKVRHPQFVACDLEVLATAAPGSGTRTTDYYLAGLAQEHSMLLATLDEKLGHEAAFLIPA